jgi:hypothetical protein
MTHSMSAYKAICEQCGREDVYCIHARAVSGERRFICLEVCIEGAAKRALGAFQSPPTCALCGQKHSTGRGRLVVVDADKPKQLLTVCDECWTPHRAAAEEANRAVSLV